MWSVATVSFLFVVLIGFRGRSVLEVVFRVKMRTFGRATPDLAPSPWGATGEFLAQNLDLAGPSPRL